MLAKVKVASAQMCQTGVESCLEPFLFWMKLIGLSPSHFVDSRSAALIHRWISFVLVVAVQSCLVGHIFFNAENVASSYSEDNPSKALSWNFLIDALNFAVTTVGSYGALLLLTRSDVWEPLINSFNLFIIPSCPETRKKCRKLSIIAVTGIVVVVSFKSIMCCREMYLKKFDPTDGLSIVNFGAGSDQQRQLFDSQSSRSLRLDDENLLTDSRESLLPLKHYGIDAAGKNPP